MKVKIISKPSSQIIPLVEKISNAFTQAGYAVVNNEDADVVVAVGGDGTLLRAVKMGKPVIAVKAGRRGILMDVEPDSIIEVVKRLKEGDYEVEEYSLLEVIGSDYSAIAFNEIGVLAEQPETILLELSFLEKDIRVEGDGILVSTPQGSTGWSLSATGTMIYGIRAIAITLMNPVLSSLKSIVIPPAEIQVRVLSKGYPQNIRITADGSIVKVVSENSRLLIRESDKKGVIYRFYKINPIRGVLCGTNCV